MQDLLGFGDVSDKGGDADDFDAPDDHITEPQKLRKQSPQQDKEDYQQLERDAVAIKEDKGDYGEHDVLPTKPFFVVDSEFWNSVLPDWLAGSKRAARRRAAAAGLDDGAAAAGIARAQSGLGTAVKEHKLMGWIIIALASGAEALRCHNVVSAAHREQLRLQEERARALALAADEGVLEKFPTALEAAIDAAEANEEEAPTSCPVNTCQPGDKSCEQRENAIMHNLVQVFDPQIVAKMKTAAENFKQDHGRPLQITFVCHGNTCRSALAERIVRQILGDSVVVNSAGVKPAFPGSPLDPHAQIIACGTSSCDKNRHQSKQLEAKHVENSDLVVFMNTILRKDAMKLDAFKGLGPVEADTPKHWVTMTVPDPWIPKSPHDLPAGSPDQSKAKASKYESSSSRWRFRPASEQVFHYKKMADALAEEIGMTFTALAGRQVAAAGPIIMEG